MKAILNFNLDDPDDRVSHQRAVQGAELANRCGNFKDWMRNQIKHNDKDYLAVQKAWFEIMEGMDYE